MSKTTKPLRQPTTLEIAYGKRCEAELAFREAEIAWAQAQIEYLNVRQKYFDSKVDQTS